MTCTTFYDFINDATVQLPTVARASAVIGEDRRHGVRAILNPDEAAHTLLGDHLRTLSEMHGARSNNNTKAR